MHSVARTGRHGGCVCPNEAKTTHQAFGSFSLTSFLVVGAAIVAAKQGLWSFEGPRLARPGERIFFYLYDNDNPAAEAAKATVR